MSEAEAGPSTRNPSTPKAPTVNLNANIETFERLKQKAALLPVGSTGKDNRRPKSINGQPLAAINIDTQAWNQSPTRGVFLPPLPEKSRLYEYKQIWRKNHTLSLGTTLSSKVLRIKELTYSQTAEVCAAIRN